MAKVDIRSKAIVLLLVINFFIVTQIVCGVLCLALILLVSTLCLSSFAIGLMGKRKKWFLCYN